MTEVSELPSAESIFQEALQEPVSFSSENCFNILSSGTVPPGTTAKLDAYRMIQAEENRHETFAAPMPKEWQFIVEECGNNIIENAAKLGVKITDIEKFYPIFVPKNKKTELQSSKDTRGFTDVLMRRPIVFVDTNHPEITIKDIAVIHHEMNHAATRRTVMISYDPSKEPVISKPPVIGASLGVSTFYNNIVEEAIAHRDATSYLNDESLYDGLRKSHLNELKKRAKKGVEVFPFLNEITEPRKGLETLLLDSTWVDINRSGKRTYVVPNDADRLVSTILDILPVNIKQQTEKLLRKSRYTPGYKYGGMALRAIADYWGEEAMNLINNVQYTSDSMNSTYEKLQNILESKKTSAPQTVSALAPSGK